MEVEMVPMLGPSGDPATTRDDFGLNETEKAAKLTWRKRFFSGWRSGVSTSACLCTVVLLVNVIWTAWAFGRPGGSVGGFTTLFRGDCNKSQNLSRWLHLGINILGTILLGASNYTQQCLVAPTRTEVDRAHAKYQWLDVGIQSTRNQTAISGKRVFLFWLLALSSIPFHLFFNSAIFEDSGAISYAIYTATSDQLNNSLTQPYPALRNRLKSFDRLEIADCLQSYSSQFVFDRKDLILVLANDTPKSILSLNTTGFSAPNTVGFVRPQLEGGTIGTYARVYPSYEWFCRLVPLTVVSGYSRFIDCDVNAVIANASTWSLTIANQTGPDLSAKVDHCLSEPVGQQQCRLRANLGLMLVIIFFNLFKLICMIGALLIQTEQPLVTVGDAISSFLNNPDPSTKGKGDLAWEGSWGRVDRDVWTGSKKVKPWKKTRHRLIKATSVSRWVVCYSMIILILIIAGLLLKLGISHIYDIDRAWPTMSDLWAMGFGSLNVKALIDWNGTATYQYSLILMVLIANLPQLLLSIIYFSFEYQQAYNPDSYNGLFTMMCLNLEWNQLGCIRKGLRVTTPKGVQRSTYWLSLPKIYAIPLMLFSAGLHFLVSQSIFLASITVLHNGEYGLWRDSDISPQNPSLITCGYSPIAMIATMCVGGFLGIVGILNGMRRLKPGIQMLGSCSAVVSACCHGLNGDKADWHRGEDAALLPVKWGVVVEEGEEEDGRPGHCCITSINVTEPVEGHRYT